MWNSTQVINSTSNSGQTYRPGESPSLSITSLIQLSLMLCISSIGTFGNFVVLIILSRRKNRRKTSNILLLNLAVCDTLVSAVCISLDVTELLHQRWVFGRELCSMIYPFQTGLPIVSSYTMLFMLFERNLLFSKRIRSTLRSKTIRIFACITWLLPIAVVLPYALQLYVDEKGGNVSCSESWPKEAYRKAYTIILSLTEYVVPMFFIVFLMIKIYGYLRRERQVVKRGTLGLERRTSIRRIKRNKRLTIIFIVMVSTYGILKLPNNAFWQWVEFGSGGTSEHFAAIRCFVGLCAYSTCATNPFILLLMSSEMRNDMKIMLTRCRKEYPHPKDKQSESSEVTTLNRCSRNRHKLNRLGSVRLNYNTQLSTPRSSVSFAMQEIVSLQGKMKNSLSGTESELEYCLNSKDDKPTSI